MVGPDTGERESNGVYPVLADVRFEAVWTGDDHDAPGVMELSSLGQRYTVTGPDPDANSAQTILIDTRFQIGAVGMTQTVVPNELREGLIRVPGEAASDAYVFISRAEFEERSRECSPGSIVNRAWGLTVLAVLIVGLAIVVYNCSGFAQRRRLRQIPPPNTPPSSL